MGFPPLGRAVLLWALLASGPAQAQESFPVPLPPSASQGWLNAAELSARLEAVFTWNSGRQIGQWTRGRRVLTFDPSTGLVLRDGRDLLRLTDFDYAPGRLRFSPGAAEQLARWFDEGPSGRRVGVILIDPGHGGQDPGALGSFRQNGREQRLQEKDVTLRAGLALAERLRAGLPGVRIVLTRQTDTYPTLEQRVELAHQQELKEGETILFVSLHANASLNTRARGFETWHIPMNYDREVVDRWFGPDKARPVINSLLNYEYKAESQRMAEFVQRALHEQIGALTEDRGLREQPWFVVRMARMPAILVEMGFVTHEEEAARLADPEYLKKIVEGLYNGLTNFTEWYARSPWGGPF